MKKGVLELCILLSLREKDRYGYELMKLIKDPFPDVYDGSVYTILRRLSEGGYADTYMRDIPSGGPQRKYYRITMDGKAYAEALCADWQSMTVKVSRFIHEELQK